MKKHDWFAANLFQPELSITDFYNAGIIPNNTEIKSKDYYKSVPAVIDAFTENGTFNENKFEKFYDSALLTYNKYSSDEYGKHVLNEFDYDPAEWRKPIGSKTKNTTTYFQIGKHNLPQDTYGIENLGIKTSKDYSVREIAQMNKVRDANGNVLDWTPNDKGGLFKSLTRPTLVLATYDQDTVENVNGRQILRKKGDLMLDDEGNPFYRELASGESTYGKDVLHISDTLTDDDSKWNKYDFFDSDGVEKSIGGTIMKTAASLLPYLIPGGKYVKAAKWTLAGVQASTEMAKVLPVLGKAVSGTFGATEDNSAFYNNMTEWESYMSRFDSSVSDKTRNDQWTLETFGNLVSDITGQLFQQRAVSAVPTLLKKAGFLDGTMNNVKLGQEMALGYMAMTSARDSYSSFIEAGANNETAGIAALASMLALNTLMRQDYFRKTLFKGSFFDEDNLKSVTDKVARQLRIDDMLEGTAKEKLTKIQKRMASGFTAAFTDYKGAMLREGIEEVMEEAVFDFSKGIAEGLQALGIPVSDNNLDFKWDDKEMFSRYAMSFIGGAIGGGIFNAAHDFQLRGQSDIIKSLDESDLSKMTYLIAEGRTQELRDYVTKLYKKGLLGDSNLSGSKSQVVKDIDGNGNLVFETEGESQNDLIYRQMMRHIDYIDTIVSQEGLKLPEEYVMQMIVAGIDPKDFDNKTFTARILNLAMITGGFLNDVDKLRVDLVKYRSELESLMEPYRTKTDSDKDKDGWKDDEKVKRVQEKLKELRKKRDSMLSGEMNNFYAERGFFAMDTGTNQNFINFSKERFAEVMKGKRYIDLSDQEKEELDLDYEDYKNTALKRNVFRAYDVYNKLSELYAPTLQQLGNSLESYNEDTVHGSETNIAIRDGLVKTYNERVKQYNELKSKTNRTSEEEVAYSDLKNELNELKIQLALIESRTSELLRGKVESELHISSELDPRVAKFENVVSVQNYLRFLYSQFVEKKTFVRSEDELQEYYRSIRGLQNTSVQDRFANFFDDVASVGTTPFGDFEDGGESFAVEVNGRIENLLEFASDGNFNARQREFIGKVKDLEQTFGDEHTQRKIDELLKFIQKYANVSPELAQSLLESVTSIKINDEYGNVQTASLLGFRNEIETLREQLVFSPLNNLLKIFQSEFGGDLTIADLLNKELHNLASRPYMDEFIIGNAKVKDELKHTLQLLNAIRAIVNGAYSGLNERANKLRKEGAPQLAILGEKSATMLMNDIVAMQKKIQVLLNLDENNSAQKLRVHKESEMKMKPMFVKYLIDSKNTFKDQFDIDIQDLWDESDTNDIGYEHIDDLNWAAFEATRVLFESKIYDAIKAKGYADVAKRIVAMFSKNIYKMESTRISTNTEVLTAYDVAEYLLDIVAIRCSDFTSRYKEILERRKTDGSPKLAPVVGQEFAIRRDVCNAANPALYNEFLEELHILAQEDNEEYVKNKRLLKNTSLALGGAGTGKTVAIGGISADILAFDDDVQFVFVASNDDQVEKLQKSVRHNGKMFTTDDETVSGNSHKNIFNEYVSGDLPNPFYDKVKERLDFNPIVLNSSKTLFDPSKSKKVIIIDEVTLLDVVKLQALVQMAEREGAVIWAYGDLKQNQAETEITHSKDESGNLKKDDDILSNGIEDFFVIKSPTLTTSLRSGNEAKFHNASELDVMLTNVIERAQSEEAYTEEDYDKITKQVNSEPITLHYYDEGDIFVGEKMVNDSAGISAVMNRLAKKIVTEEPEEKNRKARIAYITDDNNVVIPTDTNPELAGIVKHVKANKVQGGEYDYVIIDKKWPNSRWAAARDFYTLTQRSTKGTIFVDNGISSLLNFNSVSDPSFVNNSKPSDDQIQQFIDWKLNGLRAISISGSITPYFKNAIKPNLSSTTSTTSAPTNPTSSSPTESTVGTPSNSTPTAVSQVTPVSPTVPVASITSSPSGTGIGPFVEEPYDFTDEGEPIYPEFQEGYYPIENPIEEPPYEPIIEESVHDDGFDWEDEDAPTSIFTDEGVFAERFGRWDLSKRIEVEDTFGVKLNGERSLAISEEDYRTLMQNVPGLIKYLPRKMWEKEISDLLRNMDIHMNSLSIDIRIKDRDGKGDVFCILKNNGTKEIISFPVTVVDSGHNGFYNGEFYLKQKGWFSEGEWMTLDALKQKYPTLVINDNWGCISLSPLEIEEFAATHALEFRDTYEEGVTFLQNWFNENNGKGMILITDNGYVMLHADNVWNYGSENGWKWMHSFANILTQVGMERPLDASVFLKFLHYRHLRMTVKRGDPRLKEGLIFEQKALATDETFLENGFREDSEEDSRAFHEQMRNRRFQILNYQTTVKLFNAIFYSMSDKTSVLMKKCFSAIKFSLQLGRVLHFRSEQKEMLYTLHKNENKYIITSQDVNGNITTEIWNDLSQQRLYNFVQENEAEFVRLTKGSYSMSNNEMLYDLFSRVISDSNGAMLLNNFLQNREQFKYGLFPNVAGGNYYSSATGNSIYRKIIHTKEGWMTNATIWNHSIYGLDSDLIVPGDFITARVELDKNLQYEEDVEQIKTVLSGAIDLNTIVSIKNKRPIAEIVSEVNDKLSRTLNYPVQTLDYNSDGFSLIKTNDINAWLEGVAKQFGLDPNTIHKEFSFMKTCKSVIFSVNSHDYYRVCQNSDGKWELFSFNSFPEFQIAYNNSKDTNAITYLRESVSSVNSTVDINLLMEEMSPELLLDINNYLLKRLENNEC